MIYNKVSIYYISLFSIITIYLPLYILRNEEKNYDKEFMYMISLHANTQQIFHISNEWTSIWKTTASASSIIYPYMKFYHNNIII